MSKVYKLEPAFKDVIWGGEKLFSIYNKKIPTVTTGEAFEASIVPGFVCKTSEGSFSSLAENKLMTGEGGFNLLFKLIDAKEKLSVQVHPDNEMAKLFEGASGKTECWYVLDAKEGAFLYLGFNEGVTEADFKRACYEGGMEELLAKVYVKKGDFFFVPAGCVHAIGEGVLIAELQQSSDTTYRVYDYERRDKNGNLRETHKEEAIACAKVMPYEPMEKEWLEDNIERLAKCEYFDIQRVKGNSSFKTEGKYILLFFIEGTGEIKWEGTSVKANSGDTFFIPASLEGISIDGDATYLKMTE